MSEEVYDTLLDEIRLTRADVTEQLDYHTLLYQNRQNLQASRDYAADLLRNIEVKISGINHSFDELKALSITDRNRVNRERQDILRTLCERVIIFANGDITIEGLIDVEAMSQEGDSRTTAPSVSPPRKNICAPA